MATTEQQSIDTSKKIKKKGKKRKDLPLIISKKIKEYAKAQKITRSSSNTSKAFEVISDEIMNLIVPTFQNMEGLKSRKQIRPQDVAQACSLVLTGQYKTCLTSMVPTFSINTTKYVFQMTPRHSKRKRSPMADKIEKPKKKRKVDKSKKFVILKDKPKPRKSTKKTTPISAPVSSPAPASANVTSQLEDDREEMDLVNEMLADIETSA